MRVAVELATELARRGCDVHVFARSAPLAMAAPPGVAFHTLHNGAVGEAFTSRLDVEWSRAELDDFVACVLSTAQHEQLDVLHFHYAVPFAWVVEEVGRAMGPRSPALIGTLHGTDVSVFGRKGRTRDALVSALAQLDAITTVSQSHAALAVRAFGLSTTPHVIPNFVDLNRFRPAAFRGVPRGRPGIVHVSNFRPVKRLESMARVFVAVRREVDAELWLVGDGEAMAKVRTRFERAGVDGALKLFGLRMDAENVLQHADVLLVTSRTESFCLAALEAAACGVPVVAPRVGGLPEVVADGHTGLLFESGDEEAAAGAIVRLLGDTLLREKMARAAVRHAQHFSTEAVVPRYERLYRQAIAARHCEAPMPVEAGGRR